MSLELRSRDLTETLLGELAVLATHALAFVADEERAASEKRARHQSHDAASKDNFATDDSEDVSRSAPGIPCSRCENRAYFLD